MENIGAVFFSVHRWFFLPPRGGSTGIFVPYTEKELACSEICKPGRQRRRLFHTAGEICRSLPPTSFIRPVLGLARGGWALIGTAADPDITAMALQALVNYKDQSEVAAAAERAFAKLSAIQKDNGGYASWGSVNSESIAQVIVATTAWGIDPDTDPRFVKNGKSAVDALLTFYVEEGRGFAHVLENSPGYVGGEVNGMATDQACYALVAYNRFQNGKTALYDMSDVNFPCTAHKFSAWSVTTPATCTKDGVETRTCTVCQTAETRAVKAVGHKFGTWEITKSASLTETGDGSQMTLWLGGALLSAAALAVLVRQKKRIVK